MLMEIVPLRVKIFFCKKNSINSTQKLPPILARSTEGAPKDYVTPIASPYPQKFRLSLRASVPEKNFF